MPLIDFLDIIYTNGIEQPCNRVPKAVTNALLNVPEGVLVGVDSAYVENAGMKKQLFVVVLLACRTASQSATGH